MQINYIILAHKNPRQLKRLLEKLENINCNFYIHIDKSTDIFPFIEELSHIENLHFTEDEKRVHSIWGDIGLVKATINVFEQIIVDKRGGYCILLSGQDYPIKSNDFIRSFLINNPNTNFISTFSIPSDRWADNGLQRFLLYKVNVSNKRSDFVLLPSIFESRFYTKKTIKGIFSLLLAGKFQFSKKALKKRKIPHYVLPFGGEHWWALPIETIRQIIDFLQQHRDYYVYHEDTLLPEEIFFHSIVMHLFSNDPQMRIEQTLTYVNWERENAILPVTFSISDFDEIKMQSLDKLFARKFDIDVDENILNMIDEMILKSEIKVK